MEMEELNNNQNIAFDKVWISLFVSIIFFIAVSIGLVRDYKLLFSGVKTTATIVSRDVKESIRASRDKIIIVFQFNDTTGKRFTGREELPEKLVNSAEFQQGMKRTATYLPSDPALAQHFQTSTESR
jgi:hypothetical protein